MCWRHVQVALALVALTLAVVPAAVQPQTEAVEQSARARLYRVRSATSEITIDGALDEPAWRTLF